MVMDDNVQVPAVEVEMVEAADEAKDGEEITMDENEQGGSKTETGKAKSVNSKSAVKTRSKDNQQVPRSRARSDSSENNCPEMATNKIIPCCRKRKCRNIKELCVGETVCGCFDPCCCYPVAPPAVLDNLRLKQENKALKHCIKRVKRCAVSEASDIIQEVMDGCKCGCCQARTKLRRCKSGSSILGRETWLCVPMAGSSGCGGYTPSGWSKLHKKCQEYTADPCTVCDFTARVGPCVSRRYKCLPYKKPCPPCPHLCPVRALPMKLRPSIPCCPLYFPTHVCQSSLTSKMCAEKSYTPCGCSHSGTTKASPITAPPYQPKYTPATVSARSSKIMPHPSPSVPVTSSKGRNPSGTQSSIRGTASR